jgi:hypothetical protein
VCVLVRASEIGGETGDVEVYVDGCGEREEEKVK